MQASNFDELTKALATTRSRRHALRLILTASVGSLFGLTSVGTAFGRHRSKLSVPSGPTGNSNCAKVCAAVFGANTSAAGQCTSDGAHGRGLCSRCGNAVPSSICCVRNTSGFCSGSSAATCPCNANDCQTCDQTHGICVGCPSSLNCCLGVCLNEATDPNNCGRCRHQCPSPQGCCSGQCTDLTTTSNCGSCGHVCASGETCVTGSCTCGSHGDCPSGQSCCSGMCVDELTDPNNCGGCGTACGSGQGCCNGTCTDLTTTSNCGSCGNVCSGGSCINGSCCPSAQVCNGTCCTSPDTCVNGQCTCVTPPLPPPGPNLIVCHCSDGARPAFCSSISCNDPRSQLCNDVCLCHGGSPTSECGPSSICS